VENTCSDKSTSLLFYIINYGRKIFVDQASVLIEDFFEKKFKITPAQPYKTLFCVNINHCFAVS